MAAAQTARALLRAATADSHQRVDDLFSQVDLADRDGYARFLTAQAAAHLPTEAALTASGAETVLADWPERRRGDLLRADLAAMALPVPEGGMPLTFDNEAAILGGIYVLEGSRLGGRMLRRSVPPQLPARFLDAADPTGWRRLLDLLERRLCSQIKIAQATRAAIAVFGLFERSAKRQLGCAPTVGPVDPAGWIDPAGRVPG